MVLIGFCFFYAFSYEILRNRPNEEFRANFAKTAAELRGNTRGTIRNIIRAARARQATFLSSLLLRSQILMKL